MRWSIRIKMTPCDFSFLRRWSVDQQGSPFLENYQLVIRFVEIPFNLCLDIWFIPWHNDRSALKRSSNVMLYADHPLLIPRKNYELQLHFRNMNPIGFKLKWIYWLDWVTQFIVIPSKSHFNTLWFAVLPHCFSFIQWFPVCTEITFIRFII